MASSIEHPIGKKIGMLQVVSATKHGSTYKYLCTCDCGRQSMVRRDHLLSASTRSCGCLAIKHGLYRGYASGTKFDEASIWSAMRGRCNNPKSTHYHLYGGRGIRICSRWDDLAAFVSDMGPRPSKKHSIDRIDPNGDYTPENCRWATQKEQCRNLRKCVLTMEKANRVREMNAAGASREDIANEVGISKGYIYHIVNNRRWA